MTEKKNSGRTLEEEDWARAATVKAGRAKTME